MADDNRESLRKAYTLVEGLRPWNRGGQRAPHKPLLLLMALSRTKAGGPRLVEFAEIEGPLRELLIRYGPERSHHHPEYPFWRLQHDGIWEVIGGDHLPRRASNTDPLASALRSHHVRGGLVPDLDRELRADPGQIVKLAEFTATSHLPEVGEAVLNELSLT